MGYAISWLAVKDKDPILVQQQFELSSTVENGDYADFPLVGRLLPSGWYLLVANRCDHKIISEAFLAKYSLASVMLACSIEEHVMFFSAELWEKGQRIWHISHRGGDFGVMDLVVEGQPPAVFEAIKQDYFAKQAVEDSQPQAYPCDYISEIPMQLAKYFVGFKHDEITPGVEDGSFEILSFEQQGLFNTSNKPWWHFW